MADKTMKDVIHDVDEFKLHSIEDVRKNIENEVTVYKEKLPSDVLTDEFNAQIQQEVDAKLTNFYNDMDVKPTALYYSLKSDAELNEDITEQELTVSAYDFLEKNTKSKFLKKILRELKKEAKK